MPDKKLTDAEIMEVLPFLAKYCKDEYNYIRIDEVLSGAYDLINRLRAENERLNKRLELTRKVSLTRREQNIRKDELMIKMATELKTVKSEAYKECIENVKEKLGDIAKIDWQDNYYYLVGEAFFNNLLREMIDAINKK